ncbi:MAG: IS4 family transposase [Imperialibacter sp.]|uniref:IS4 family transposase n=1 Tax=Imperialibacter sp. TaxID=2038411 RepID=UPI0032EB38A2
MSSESLEAMARQTGFKQRSSVITAESFLNTAFFSNAQSCPSLSEYSIGLAYDASINVSKQAIDKRFNCKTEALLSQVLQLVISRQLKRTSTLKHDFFSEIRIQDSSKFIAPKNLADTFPGYGGVGREAIAQVQLEYDLLGGKVTELSLGSALDADAKECMKNIDQIPPKALLIRDLGYFSPKAFEEIRKRNLYFVSRAKAQWFMYVKHDGQLVRLTIDDIKEKLLTQKQQYIDLDIYLGRKILSPVRLIASLIPDEQARKRIKRKKDNKTKVSKLTEQSACLNLFVTNVEREVCDAIQVYKLYTLRWQIELIFKTWKSIMRLHKIHAMNATRFKCVLLIKLIWVMLNWALLRLVEEKQACEMSLHKLSRTMVSRSQKLTLGLIQNQEAFLQWLAQLIQLSRRHHQKEYKKGDESIQDILSLKLS